MSLGRRGARRNGQALVEFALVFPLFLLLLLSVIDVGRVVWARNALQNAAREAARYAIVHGGTDATTCPVGPDALGRSSPPPPACPAGGSPDTTAAKNVARTWAIAAGNSFTVTICYGTGCLGDDTPAGTTNARGTPVTVRTSSQVPLIVGTLVGPLTGFTTFSLDATVTMLVNT